MIIPDAGDADLLTVLSRLSSCYTKLAGAFTPVSSLPLTLPSNELAVFSAFGNSLE
jgi:hypothetical protein